MRGRKEELEDIIGRRTARRKAADPKDIVRLSEDAVDNWDTDLPTIIKQHIGGVSLVLWGGAGSHSTLIQIVLFLEYDVFTACSAASNADCYAYQRFGPFRIPIS